MYKALIYTKTNTSRLWREEIDLYCRPTNGRVREYWKGMKKKEAVENKLNEYHR